MVVSHPVFGPYPSHYSPDFNFQAELRHLPFLLNIGEATLDKEQQSRFLDIIYDNQKSFLLQDEDLGYCDHITHTIPTTTDKPIYFPHRTIPRQLQGEVCKCINNWSQQGVIHPSNSPYASQVVVVHKKTGEVHLCVDYRKFNSIFI